MTSFASFSFIPSYGPLSFLRCVTPTNAAPVKVFGTLCFPSVSSRVPNWRSYDTGWFLAHLTEHWPKVFNNNWNAENTDFCVGKSILFIYFPGPSAFRVCNTARGEKGEGRNERISKTGGCKHISNHLIYQGCIISQFCSHGCVEKP